jgi:hypothetical protein
MEIVATIVEQTQVGARKRIMAAGRWEKTREPATSFDFRTHAAGK